MTPPVGGPPLADLLFSPRAAFIWNHTRKSVSWMNPAARAAFALRLEDFSASLPKSLIRRFGQYAERKEGGAAIVKIPGASALRCTVELLKLADGQDGLIVAEIAQEDLRPSPLPHPSLKSADAWPKKTARKGAANAKSARRSGKKPACPPALTAAEMRAFKAVGRKVLRLCDNGKPAQEAAAEVPAPGLENPALTAETPAQALRGILAAFDLVLYLDDGFGVLDVEGRAGRFGWRKASLRGKPVGDLLPHENRTIFERLRKKLNARASVDAAFVFRTESGREIPCRAILGRWADDRAPFFLALLSLELPARLRRPKPQEGVAAARLAA